MQGRKARDPVRRLSLYHDHERPLLLGELVAEDPHGVPRELRLELLRADLFYAHEIEAEAGPMEVEHEGEQVLAPRLPREVDAVRLEIRLHGSEIPAVHHRQQFLETLHRSVAGDRVRRSAWRLDVRGFVARGERLGFACGGNEHSRENRQEENLLQIHLHVILP
jgi:hypothetical protein